MRKLSSEEFNKTLQENLHGQEYLRIVEKVLSEKRPLVDEPGFELHHIHPRGLGGDLTAESNLIKVSCFEHCLLHVLLAKTFQLPETLYPIIRMTYAQLKRCSDLEQITLEDIYKWSKEREKALGLASQRTFSEESRKKMSESHKGRPGTTTGCIRIHKGRRGRIVKPETLETFLNDGWEIGVPERTPEHRRKLSESGKGKKVSEESKQKNREAHLGKPGGNKGRIFIHRGEELKRISPEELDKYLPEGWEQGLHASWYQHKGMCKHTAEWRAKVSKATKGRICINKDGRVKRVFEKDFPKYAEEGWTKGGVSYKRKSQDDSLNLNEETKSDK